MCQALIIMSGLQAIYDAHLRRYPQDQGSISFAVFKELKPWYAIFGDRMTCLCKWCENFLCYQDALRLAASYLAPLLSAGADGGDDDSDGESAASASESLLAKLVRISQLKSKQMVVNEFVCGGSIRDAKRDCAMQNCSGCRFQQLWSKGLRKELLDAYGKLKPGVDKVWLTKIKWERIKSCAVPGTGEQGVPASEQKEMLRQRVEGTIIELLDEFESKVMAKYPFHRQTLIKQKEAAQQCEDNLSPGVLDADSDHSENGIIANAREIQSEYWKMKHFSLFISMWRYLVSAVWIDRTSVLSKGDCVTVEPEGQSVPGSLSPPLDSFFAEVERTERTGSQPDEGDLYVVVDRHAKSHTIPRHRLRLRQWKTVAFACICNEKRHDAPTTQHWLNRILRYFVGHPTPAPAAPPDLEPPPPPHQFDRSESFWGVAHHSDNASHFKSAKMLNYWSNVKVNPPVPPTAPPPLPVAPSPSPPPSPLTRQQKLSMIWVDFGCAGHGKGPWDGLGAVIKQTVRRDILHNNIRTAWLHHFTGGSG